MRIFTTLAATVVAATLTLGGAAAAQAETQVRNDPAGDTVVPPQTRMSPASSSDILSLKGNHGADRLTFTFTLADLTAGEQISSGARFVTPSGRDFQLFGGRSDSGKQVALTRRTDDNPFQAVECDGLRARFADRTDTITLSLPRSCVGNPRTVRFGGAVQALTDFSATRPRGIVVGSPSQIDDARRNGSVGQTIKVGTRQLASQ